MTSVTKRVVSLVVKIMADQAGKLNPRKVMDWKEGKKEKEAKR